MSSADRKLTTFRLTEECRALLADLAKRRGVSQAAILELLVREESYKQNQRDLKIAA